VDVNRQIAGEKAVLELPFGFEDVDLDSGGFSELVAHGSVEKTDAGTGLPIPTPSAGAGTRHLPEPGDWTDLPPFLGLAVTPRTQPPRLDRRPRDRVPPLPAAERLRQGPRRAFFERPTPFRYLVEHLLSTPQADRVGPPPGVTDSEPLYLTTL